MSPPAPPPWMSRVLFLAAAYHLIWGGLAVLAPARLGVDPAADPAADPRLWQGLGLLVGAYGVGFGIAARDPFRHWPIVLVGLLAKLAGPLGFAWAAGRAEPPSSMGLVILGNDIVWWLPFALILRGAAREHRAATTPPVVPVDTALAIYFDRQGRSLLEASRKQPLFLVFLRHFGCTFCREALADLRQARSRIDAAGTRLVLVHMSEDDRAQAFITRYGLDDVTCIGDPERVLYRAFTLGRGSLRQLFGWSVIKRGWSAGVVGGHGVGKLEGDGFQMPGAFVVSHGQVVHEYVHQTAADRPDYGALADVSAIDDQTLAELASRIVDAVGQPT